MQDTEKTHSITGKEIPGPLSLLQMLTFYLFKNPIELYTKCHQQYGDFYKISSKPLVLVMSDPEAGNFILNTASSNFTNNIHPGDFTVLVPEKLLKGKYSLTADNHDLQRSAMNKSVGKESLQAMIPALMAIWEKYITRFSNLSAQQGGLDPYILLEEASFLSAFNVLFNLDMTLSEEQILEYLDLFNAIVTGLEVPKKIAFPIGKVHDAVVAEEKLIKMLTPVIDKALNSREEHSLLKSLLYGYDLDGNYFSQKEGILHFVIINTASYIPVAKTVSWMLYELSRHPEWQDKLLSEQEQVLDKTSPPQLDQLLKLQNHYAFLHEVERLYPPGCLIPREVVNDIDYKGYHLQKNTMIIFNIYFANRSPHSFKNPDEFQPERWIQSVDGEKVPTIANLYTFGKGKHFCFGKQFAELQAILVLLIILNKFKISDQTKEPLKVEMENSFLLLPAHRKLLFTPK